MILEFGINYVFCVNAKAPLQYSHVSEGCVEVSALDASTVTPDPIFASDCAKRNLKFIYVTDTITPPFIRSTYITSTYIDNIRYTVHELDSYPVEPGT